MSYCRFQNTLGDLRDCNRALQEFFASESELSRDERDAAADLIELCQRIALESVDSLTIHVPGSFDSDNPELLAEKVVVVLDAINVETRSNR